MNSQEILTRLKIGLSMLAGFATGKLAAAYSPAHYSALFSAGFLAGVIATQGALHLLGRWRQSRRAD